MESTYETGRLAWTHPLFYQHVNPYGRFTLDMAQRLPLSLTNIA